MKIALLLQGIHYNHYNNKMRDFRNHFSNINENIIQDLGVNNTVSKYLYTYPSDMDKLLVEKYQPTDYKIVPFEGSNQISTKVNSLKFIKDINVDIIVMTRFDLYFKDKFSNFNINFSKFNFANREEFGNWTKHQYCCDNLYIFPKHMLDRVLSSFIDLETIFLSTGQAHAPIGTHDLYTTLSKYVSDDEINYMDISFDNNIYSFT